MKASHTPFVFLSLWLLYACGSTDLSFINDVKRFEPRWMSISEQAARIQHNLSITERRYERDMESIAPMINRGREDWAELLSMKNQYRRIIDQRDSLEVRYERKKGELTETVRAFNEWENQLMKDELNEDEARSTFEAFKQQHGVLEKDINGIYTELVQNIESHNAILRRLAQALNLYNNFDIDPR